MENQGAIILYQHDESLKLEVRLESLTVRSLPNFLTVTSKQWQSLSD